MYRYVMLQMWLDSYDKGLVNGMSYFRMETLMQWWKRCTLMTARSVSRASPWSAEKQVCGFLLQNNSLNIICVFILWFILFCFVYLKPLQIFTKPLICLKLQMLEFENIPYSIKNDRCSLSSESRVWGIIQHFTGAHH